MLKFKANSHGLILSCFGCNESVHELQISCSLTFKRHGSVLHLYLLSPWSGNSGWFYCQSRLLVSQILLVNITRFDLLIKDVIRLTGWLTDKKCLSSNLMSPVQLLGLSWWEKIWCQQVVPWLPHVHHGTHAYTNTHINNTLKFKGLFNLNFLVHFFSPGYLILGVRSQTVQHNKVVSLLEFGSNFSTQEVCDKKIATNGRLPGA